MDPSPLVSAVIPVYNGERFLREAIESVLFQSHSPMELIVVDDGSTDGTKDIALSYPGLVYVYQENTGPAAAKNKGLAVAKGTYYSFLDADDVWMKDKTSLQLSAFAANPHLDIVIGLVQQFWSPDTDSIQGTKSRPIAGYHHIAMLVRPGVFHKIGYFHEDVRPGELVSWFSLVLERRLSLEVLPTVVAKRRIHNNNIGIKMKHEKNRALLTIVKKSLDRRRAKHGGGK